MKEPVFSPRVVRERLAVLGVVPSRAMGQNFLVDGNVAETLVQAIAPSSGESLLEIGPGLGVLTDRVAERGVWLTVVEKDSRLAGYLTARYSDCPRVEVVHADFFDLDLPRFLGMRRIRKVFGNLPYRSGSRMLVDLACLEEPPSYLVVTVQSEVAERLSALPGTAAYGLLTVWIGLRYRIETVRRIRPSCFYPRPAVSSTTVCLRLRPGTARPSLRFYEWTRGAFQHRRKQLGGLLGKCGGLPAWPEPVIHAALQAAGAGPRDRPETLSPEQWRALTEQLELLGGNPPAIANERIETCI